MGNRVDRIPFKNYPPIECATQLFSFRKEIHMKSKDQRRMEAIERQEYYDTLSVKQKLTKLDEGGFAAKKERARLQKK